MQKKSAHIEQKVDHLEGVSETASKKVDVLSRKLWDVFDSDMNLNQFIDYHLKDDKVCGKFLERPDCSISNSINLNNW